MFPSNFKVILRFATVPENTDDSKSVIKSPLEVISQPTTSTSNTIETCFQHCDDSESERNSSEEDDDTSDLEFTNTINIIEPNTTADCSADRMSSSIKDSDPCDRKSNYFVLIFYKYFHFSFSKVVKRLISESRSECRIQVIKI